MSESDSQSGGYSQLETVREGEFAGWRYWPGDPYEARSGPFYMTREDPATTGKGGNGNVSAFRTGPHHMNGNGSIHGGCLMTFADFALFTIAGDELESASVTINLSADFLGGCGPGALVEARGEVTRGGGKTVFVRGLITADGAPCLSFTGIIRKLSPRG